MTIYEITDDLKRLEEMAAEGELDPEIVKETFESLEGDFEDKADSYAKVRCSLLAQAEALDKEITRLTERKRVVKANADRIKDTLEMCMKAVDKPKFKTALFSFGIQKNPPSVEIVGTVPEEYKIPQPAKEDKKRMLEELKEGKKLAFAVLKQGEGLRIR